MPIEYDSTVQEARFHSPLEGFELDTVEIEIREDPLTDRQTRIVPEVFPRPDEPVDLETFADGEGCFFCPDSVQEATPTYPDFVGVDRGSVGEAVSFPNLFPYAKHSNVVVLTEDHVKPLGEFTADVLEDGLACALEYLQAVTAHDDEVAFASINMNLLPSAGSSVVHPHLQTMADDRGTNEVRRIVRREREYYDDHGRTYWADLLEEERSGPRHVGSTGDVEWIAPFAPAHQWHVAGVTDVTGIPDPDAEVVGDLAAGLENVLEYYADLGLTGHNFSLLLTPDEPASPAVMDVVARPALEEYYVSDAFFFTTLHDERVVDVAPEEYAPEVGETF